MNPLIPNILGVAAPYWKAAQQGRLTLPYCRGCAAYHWPPRAACPHCRADYTWRVATGAGCLATWTIVRRAPQSGLHHAVPYALGFVELDEGVRLFAHIVCRVPAALSSGMRVRCAMRASQDPAIQIPVFVVEGA